MGRPVNNLPCFGPNDDPYRIRPLNCLTYFGPNYDPYKVWPINRHYAFGPIGGPFELWLLKAHVIVGPYITFGMLVALGTYGPLSGRFHFRPFNDPRCMWAYFWSEVTFSLLPARNLHGYILAQLDYWPVKGP